MLSIGGSSAGGGSGSASYSDEQVRDVIGNALVAGANVAIAVDDAADTITISASVPSGYSDEQAQDAFAALIAAGSHAGISFSYNDAGNALSATVSAQSWSQITGKPAFATVATSGSYTDLTDKPSITPATRNLTAGTGLTGGGDLTADRSFAVAYGTTAGTAAQGNDGRLTDTRTPSDGTVTDAKVAAGAAIDENKLALASDAAAGVPSRRTLGTGATQAAAGNDARLTNARTPTSHAASHAAGGGDPVTPVSLGAALALTPTGLKTAAHTAVSGDLVMVDATSGPVTITLPAAAAGRAVGVKKTDPSTNAVTVLRAGSDTIGSEAAVSIPIKTNDQATHFLANGANWVIPYNHLSLAALDLRFPPATTVAATTRAVSANTTAVVGETLWVSASGGNRVVTAPASATAGARVLLFKSDTSTNTVSWNGTINGDTGGAVLYQAGSGVGLVFDGTAWWVEYTSSAATGSGSASTTPAAAGVRPGRYDAARNVYTPSPAAMRGIRGALARAATGELINLVCVGDSRVAGVVYGVSTAWPSQLRTRLTAAGIPSAGTGFVGANYLSTGGSVDSRITFSGSGWNAANPPLRAWTASGATATFVSDVAGTVADIYYEQGSGTFTVSIDGVSQGTVTPAAGSGIVKRTYTGLSNQTHTVLLTSSSASGNLAGFNVSGTTGVLVHNVSVGGFTSTNVASTAAGSLQAITNAIGAHVFGLMVGCNDPAQGTPITAATMATNLTTILGTNNASAAKFMVVESPNQNYMADWSSYVGVQYNAADTYVIPILDLNDRYGTPALGFAAGLIASDNLHETPAGVNDVARAAAGMLTA